MQKISYSRQRFPPLAYSGVIRPAIPIWLAHPFRSYPPGVTLEWLQEEGSQRKPEEVLGL